VRHSQAVGQKKFQLVAPIAAHLTMRRYDMAGHYAHAKQWQSAVGHLILAWLRMILRAILFAVNPAFAIIQPSNTLLVDYLKRDPQKG